MLSILSIVNAKLFCVKEVEITASVDMKIVQLSDIHIGYVVKFYNKRGTAEQWIKEGKYAF